MTALNYSYRWTLKNGTGVNITAVTLTARKWKYDPSTGLTYAAETTELSFSGTLANTAFTTGSTVDNSTNKYEGGAFVCSVTAATSASGVAVLYLEHSTDGGTTWPTNGYGRPICPIPFTAGGTNVASFNL